LTVGFLYNLFFLDGWVKFLGIEFKNKIQLKIQMVSRVWQFFQNYILSVACSMQKIKLSKTLRGGNPMKMKRLMMILCSLTLLLSMTGLAFATQSYHDEYVHTQSIDTSGSTPAYWVQLYFPDSTTRGTYGSGGVFEYDGYISQVNSFKIKLTGHGDNSSNTIDFFLDFDSNHSAYSGKIAGYDVPTSSSFTLTLDIKNNDLLYNGTDVGNLSNVNLNSFVGYDTFWVGYACTFYHDKTEVDVSVNGGQVPEPGTLLLVGAGLLGLGAKIRRHKK
jgi:hypothetical protein